MEDNELLEPDFEYILGCLTTAQHNLSNLLQKYSDRKSNSVYEISVIDCLIEDAIEEVEYINEWYNYSRTSLLIDDLENKPETLELIAYIDRYWDDREEQ